MNTAASSLVHSSIPIHELFGRAAFMLRNVFLLLIAVFACNLSLAATGYRTDQTAGDFLSESFPGNVPEQGVIWLTGKRKVAVKKILGHRYPSLRVHYWRKNQRSVWILEETGKEKPITAGLVINKGRLERIKVLVYRESRGWEVRYPFFTDQFKGIGLAKNGNLDRQIDGISGASLSSRAMKKLATLALYLDAQLRSIR